MRLIRKCVTSPSCNVFKGIKGKGFSARNRSIRTCFFTFRLTYKGSSQDCCDSALTWEASETTLGPPLGAPLASAELPAPRDRRVRLAGLAPPARLVRTVSTEGGTGGPDVTAPGPFGGCDMAWMQAKASPVSLLISVHASAVTQVGRVHDKSAEGARMDYIQPPQRGSPTAMQQS